MKPSAIERAIAHVGSQEKLAESLDVTSSAISQWKTDGVPPDRCVDIEEVTNGAVTRADLRPDLFGPLKRRRRAEARTA